MKYSVIDLGNDVRAKKFAIVVVAVTGECNLHCEFCAYDTIKKHKKIPYATLEKFFDEIDACGDDQQWLIC